MVVVIYASLTPDCKEPPLKLTGAVLKCCDKTLSLFTIRYVISL